MPTNAFKWPTQNIYWPTLYIVAFKKFLFLFKILVGVLMTVISTKSSVNKLNEKKP